MIVDDWPADRYTARWTDDFSSILPVMYWEEGFDWLNDLLEERVWSPQEEEGGGVDEDIDFVFDEVPDAEDESDDE